MCKQKRAILLCLCLAGCSSSSAPVQNDLSVGDAGLTDGDVADASASVTDGSTHGDGAMPNAPNLFADATGTVEVFINGTSVAKTTSVGATVSVAAPLVDGENIIVLRATKAAAAQPFAHAQIGGAFGKAGTSSRWKAKLATGTTATEANGAWTTLGYNDSSWGTATDVNQGPLSGFPTDGPGRGIWTANAADATVLLRLTLYVPAGWSADKPLGFGNAVTGGAGGSVVTVATPADLTAAVTNPMPLVIKVVGTIDFTGLEGPGSAMGCVQKQCTAPTPSQYRIDYNGFCASVGETPSTLNFDAAGKNPLLVASNKTIVGVGADATVRGKGFKITGANNVIIRNLTIRDINPQVIFAGDAIHVDNADSVWVDHVRFAVMNRQMIVTGMGKATNITLSYNEFDGRTQYSAKCDGTHYWVMLIVGADNTITAYGNWLHNTSGRSPESGGYNSVATLHYVNNYYDTIPGIGANPYTTNSKYLFEGTYFRDVDKPILPDTSAPPAPGLAYAPLDSTVASTAAACQAALGRACTANIAAPQNGSFPLNQAVLDKFGTYPQSAKISPYPAAEVPNAVPHLAGPGHI